MTVTNGDIACRELVELLTEYLDGALPSDVVARIDSHLVGCAGCASFLAQLRATIVLLGHVPEQVAEQMPAELRAALLAAYRGS